MCLLTDPGDPASLCLSGQPRAANNIAYSCDPSSDRIWLLTSAFKGPLKLWDLRDGSHAKTFGGVAVRTHWALKLVYPMALSLQVGRSGVLETTMDRGFNARH